MKTPKWMRPYLKMTKAQLIAIIEPEMGIEETLRLNKLSKQALARRVRAAVRAAEREARKPCPKGHKPGDPACSLMCYVVPIEPFDTDLKAAFPPEPAPNTCHEWVEAQFEPVTKRRRFRLCADTLFGGWWWRKPYGWFLKLKGRFTK